MKKVNHLYDIYVLYTSGIPIIAGCTGSDYCKNHIEQHELHAGFFSALYSFSKESGVGSNLRSIDFDDIQIAFNTNDEKGLILVLVYPKHVSKKKVKKELNLAFNIFLNKYLPLLTPGVPDEQVFNQYRHDLFQNKIIPRENLSETVKIQMEKESFFKRWFKK